MPDLARFESALKKEQPKKEEEFPNFSYTYIQKKFKLTDDQIFALMEELTDSTPEEFKNLIKETKETNKLIKSDKSAITSIGKKWDMWRIVKIAKRISEEEQSIKPHLPKEIKDPYDEMGICYQCGKAKMININFGTCKDCFEIDSEVINETRIDLSIKDKMERFTEQHEQIENKPEQFIPSYIILANGGAGSGKTQFGAKVGKSIFIIDNENKFKDLKAYSDDKQISMMTRAKNPYEIDPHDSFVECLAYDLDTGEPDLNQTWENIKTAIEWYKKIGFQTHDGIMIDVGYILRESRIAVEESKKGRQLTQFEYRPVTGDVKPLLKGLILFCKENRKNCVIITHWAPDYISVTNSYGYKESVVVGYSPDVKPWIRDLVTWRIDFLKPKESGFPGKFIAYFDKSPKFQYQHVDITNKDLYDIINDPVRFAEEINIYKKMFKKKQIAEKEK